MDCLQPKFSLSNKLCERTKRTSPKAAYIHSDLFLSTSKVFKGDVCSLTFPALS